MIYIVKHKPIETPNWYSYKDLGVGEIYKGSFPLNRYNPYINEATALVDILNSGDEIVGLVHYRRFFKDLTFEKAESILNAYDVITTFDQEVESPYKHLLLRLNEKTVDKYVTQLPFEVKSWFYTATGFNICNMFVSKMDFLKGYTDWLFPIITPMIEQFVLEDVTDDVTHNRTLGFIIECLFGYYCKDFKRFKNAIWECINGDFNNIK